jgi:hypothetical protein
VGRDAQQVDPHLLDVDRHLADRLHGVGMEDDALLLAHPADVLDGLERADLVIRRHDRHEDRFVGDRSADLLGVHLPVLVHRQIRDLEALAFQPLARVDDRLVFRQLGNDVITLLAVHGGDALDREVVALGGAGGEDDLAGVLVAALALDAGADQPGDLGPGLVDRLLCLPAERVAAAGGVAEVLGKVRQHRLDHPRIGAGGGVVVQVDRQLQTHLVWCP